ncbi:MAG: DnaB-like helicase N-terminal domain-containing protein, partial [Clostridium sp.]|nr:DnaB-like helicase N-terminal domain-containing protein [Clostridium sp.]
RGLEILRNTGFDVKVLKVPQGKDPDEFVRNNGKEAFLKLVKNALPLIDYRIKRAAEGIDLKDGSQLVKFAEKFAGILAELNPIEKDVYIKKISEETSIKEQALYDLLSEVMAKSQKDDNFMNKKEEIGTKLYVEPGYLKAERALIKLMFEDDFYEELTEVIKEGDFILESHNKIYSLILQGKNENTNNIISYIESRCDDIESSKELTKIKEQNILDLSNKDKLITDYLNQLESFKIKKKIEELKQRQKQLEKEGKFEESIQIARELLTYQHR